MATLPARAVPELKDRRRFLKVKLLSLAAESRIIREQEKKSQLPQLRNELHHHRVHVVRHAARHTHLAYGLIRGRKVEQLDSLQRPVNWKDVRKMIERYGPAQFDFSVLLPYERP